MILTRSNFYFTVDIPNAFTTSVNYELIIGTGPSSSITPLKTISITKAVPTSATAKSWINVADFIRDYYEISPLSFTGIAANEIQASGSQGVLVASIEATFTDSIGSNEPNVSTAYIAADGYRYYEDGPNVQLSKKILLSHNNYKADNRGYFVVPLRCESGDVNPTVDGVSVAISYTNTNTNYIKYLIIPIANYTSAFDVVFEGETINIQPITECKYPLTEIQFLNRWGALEVVHFYKASKTKIKTKAEEFKGGYYAGAGSTYDSTQHQNKKLNAYSNESINIESGFLNENYNLTIAELLQSEKVWLGQLPINVSTTNLDLKTRIVDKLISYNIDFDYAYDKMITI